jgi:hypothetical protein
MAKKPKTPFIPYRDSLGRIRNAYKISPENQEKVLRGEKVEVKPVFIKEIRKKRTKEVNGKTKIFFETETRYVNEKGKFVNEKEYVQFNYIRSIQPEGKQIIKTSEVQDFNIFSNLKNAIIQAQNVNFKGTDYTPAQLYQFIKDLSEELRIRAKVKDYPIYLIEELENGNLIITEIIQDKDEEEEEEI